MAQTIFHASIEGAQHGGKGLGDFLDYAKRSGASGAQPSNYMLQGGKLFQSAKEIKDAFAIRGMTLDGVSAHCPFWVHTSAWTGTRSGNPFIPADVAKKSPEEIEKWAENYLLKLMDLAAELGVKIMPMFWGVAFGWELATGYPWGFWQGGGYDLIAEGKERFVKKTAKLRKAANERGIYLCHEIHPGTAAMCGDDFNLLVEICDDDKCLGVNADPSHCVDGKRDGREDCSSSGSSRIEAIHADKTSSNGKPHHKIFVGWQSTTTSTGFAKQAKARCDQKPGRPQYAGVLALDLVNFGSETMLRQIELRKQLASKINSALASWRRNGKPEILRHNGDGYFFMFFNDPLLALEFGKLLSKVRGLRGLQIRMGVHVGPVIKDPDHNKQPDVVGDGINKASAVMDFGDARHILLSSEFADLLICFSGTSNRIHDLGVVVGKHGRQIHIFNFVDGAIGNPTIPTKIQEQRSATAHKT